MSDMPAQNDEERRRRGFFGSKARSALALLVLLGAVGGAGWALGSRGDDNGETILFEPAGAVGPNPFTTAGLATAEPGVFGGSGDQKVCNPKGIIDFLGANPAKAAAWVAALNADPTLTWSGGNTLTVADIPAYIGELTPTLLAGDTRVTNHGYKNGKATPRQSMLAKGTAVLVDKAGTPRSRCACGNPLTPPTGGGSTTTTSEAPGTTSSTDLADEATTTTLVGDCPAITAMPANATNVTSAPADFDGDGTSDLLKVFKVGSVWRVRAEIGGVPVADSILLGPGPSMSAIGGADVNGDGPEEAWVKVRSGPPLVEVGVLSFRECDLQRFVHDEDGSPFTAVIGDTGSQAFGMECTAGGIELYELTSSDGTAFSGYSQGYTLSFTSNPPVIGPGGASGTVTATKPSAQFSQYSQFTCGNLGPSIP